MLTDAAGENLSSGAAASANGTEVDQVRTADRDPDRDPPYELPRGLLTLSTTPVTDFPDPQ